MFIPVLHTKLWHSSKIVLNNILHCCCINCAAKNKIIVFGFKMYQIIKPQNSNTVFNINNWMDTKRPYNYLNNFI